MQGKRLSLGLRAMLAILSVALLATSTWAVSHEKVLYSFEGPPGYPATTYAGLVSDAAGNLYGTSEQGGFGCEQWGCGTVFELSPNGSGGWTETVLYTFCMLWACGDGDQPAAGLIFDGAGNLYGTTAGGGIHGDGTVFEMSPNGSGGWTETVLHSFNDNGTDGADPQFAALIFDARGNLYGTTVVGGIHCGGYGCGTAFELSPREGGGWTETVLHSFGNGTDGQNPYAGLIIDAAGNLYGTTGGGGIHGDGTVFELSPREGGGYTETVLHSFGNPATQDGNGPLGGLISDAAGNLYGTTEGGGIHSGGTAFELSPREGGGWTETLLHSFGNPATQDGFAPSAGLISDSAGNLYSTTFLGGIHSCQGAGCGTVFELTPRQGGGWTETVLHSFNDNGSDGFYPEDGLILDAHGNLYGTTPSGGIGAGTVFEITP